MPSLILSISIWCSLKRILVSMNDDCASVLKQYAAMLNMTQSEVLYQAARQFIHTSATRGCFGTQRILDNHLIALDKRAHKPCYGSPCLCCKHAGACRIGSYDGEFEIAQRYRNLLSPIIEPE